MGKTGVARVTGKDIAKAGGMPEFLKEQTKKITDGTAEVKEQAAAALKSIAAQNHGENTEALYKAGAVKPLVSLLVNGSSNAQNSACCCLAEIAAGSGEVQLSIQKTIFEGGGVPGIVKLLRMGGAAVQESVSGAAMSWKGCALAACCLGIRTQFSSWRCYSLLLAATRCHSPLAISAPRALTLIHPLSLPLPLSISLFFAGRRSPRCSTIG